MEEFKKLGLSDNVIKALEKKGFTKPTTIQAKVIPLLLEGKRDVIGQSQTGTGKTASFALPIIEKIEERSRTVQAIVLTPTRELALQVAKEISSLKGQKKLNILAVYGGAAIGPQRDSLRSGVDIVVGTPGRVIDLLKRRSLKIDQIKYAVLDEADEMLNMGFVEDIELILESTPPEKTMLLFSATMPRQILKIAKNYMRDYDFIEIEKAQLTALNVEQNYYEIGARDRVEGLKRIIDNNLDFYGIVFCNTKAAVDTLSNQLSRMNYSAAALHGDISQSQRERILQKFREKQVKILVATDVAARGIDVNDLTHVVNFSLPRSAESYVHRIGRTGRAGKKGISVTFVIPSERRKLGNLERVNKCKLTKQKLPSAEKIIKNKEAQIKTLIRSIIDANTGKESKYATMAEELLKEHSAKEVVSAVLKHSFKNELSTSSYKDLSAVPERRESTGSRRRSSGRDGGRRGGSRSRTGGSSYGRSSDRRGGSGRSDRGGSSRSYGGRSDRSGSSSSDRRGGSGRSGRSDRSEWSSKPARSDRSSRPARSASSDRPARSSSRSASSGSYEKRDRKPSSNNKFEKSDKPNRKERRARARSSRE